MISRMNFQYRCREWLLLLRWKSQCNLVFCYCLMAVVLFRLMALYNSDPSVVTSLKPQYLCLTLKSLPGTHLFPRLLKDFWVVWGCYPMFGRAVDRGYVEAEASKWIYLDASSLYTDGKEGWRFVMFEVVFDVYCWVSMSGIFWMVAYVYNLEL